MSVRLCYAVLPILKKCVYLCDHTLIAQYFDTRVLNDIITIHFEVLGAVVQLKVGPGLSIHHLDRIKVVTSYWINSV